ncbi:unnamed protein product [Adineta steineri]|uniref:Uncharacterized protein n=1 Tax=Adineta steineri TaxID=433720 RepID=A0A818Y597_9BILA|nr:unnamed protein product [Adineta steineri]CAF3747755.1 unnamed protein product [Adineta steineri]
MIIYYIRLSRARQQVLPYPMHIFVIAQPHQQQLCNSQIFWQSPTEQLPPPYSSVVQSTNTNCSIVREDSQV